MMTREWRQRWRYLFLMLGIGMLVFSVRLGIPSGVGDGLLLCAVALCAWRH